MYTSKRSISIVVYIHTNSKKLHELLGMIDTGLSDDQVEKDRAGSILSSCFTFNAILIVQTKKLINTMISLKEIIL